MNVVSFTGRLVRDCEERATKAGKMVYTFSVAVSDWSNGKEYTSYIDCTAWGIEGIYRYLKKGKLVGITGKLRQDRWQAQNGENRSKVGVSVSKVDILEKKDSGSENEPHGSMIQPGGYDLYDADIPF